MLAGQVEIRMLAELAQLKRDMDSAKKIVGGAARDIEGIVDGIRRGLGMIGVGLSAGGLLLLAKQTTDAISNFKNLGQEAGTTASRISQFEAPARAAGLSIEDIASAIFKLSQAVVAASDPMSKQAAALKSIGLNAKDLRNLKPDEMFELVARKLAMYSDGIGKNAVMQELFSKSGREMSRVVAEIAERGKLNATVTDEQAEAANKFNNQLTDLKMNSEAYFRHLANEAMPTLNKFLTEFQKSMKQVGLFNSIWTALLETANDNSLEGQVKKLDEQVKLAQQNLESAKSPWRRWAFTDDEIANMEKGVKLMERARDNAQKNMVRTGIEEQDATLTEWQKNKRKKAPDFNPAGAAEVKLYTTALQKLEEELGKLSGMTEVQKVQYEIEKGSLMNLTETHKAHLLVVASQIDKKKALLALATSEAAAIDAEIAKRDAASDSISAFNKGAMLRLQNMQFEISMLGKSSAARQKATMLRELENEMIAMTAGLEGKELAAAMLVYNQRKKQLEDGFVSQKALDQLAELLDPERIRTFGESWADAFGSASKGLAGLLNALESYNKKEKEFAEMRKVAARIDDPVERKKAEIAIGEEQTKSQLQSYAAMAGGAKSFFKEGSKGYKALEAAEKTFQAFQLASDIVKGVSAAAVAIANQGQGDPYTAWFRMAAMAAAMAAIGFAVAGAGGSGPTQSLSAQRQASQGRGSVFGDAEAKSESIANALKDIRENSTADLLYTSQMLESLHHIEAAMAGVANLIIRSSGAFTGRDTSGLGLGSHDNVNFQNVAHMSGLWGINDMGGILQRVTGWLFGSSSRSLADTGLQINPQTLGAARQGISASQYADVQVNNKGPLGGLFGGNSTSIDPRTQALGDVMARQLTMIVDGMATAIERAAVILGADGQRVRDILNGISLDLTKISFKDMKGTEIEDALNAVFGQLGDTMVNAVTGALPDMLGALADFQHVGEGAFETIVRVANGVERARAVLGQWGVDIVDWRNIVNKQGDVTVELIRDSLVASRTTEGVVSSVGHLIQGFEGTAEELVTFYERILKLESSFRSVGIPLDMLSESTITAAGGIARLQAGVDVYLDRFFTTEEKTAAQRAEMERQFKALGVSMPATRAEFRAMIEAAKAAGDTEMLGRLLALAPAFDVVAAAGESAAARLTQAWSDFSDLVDKLTGRNPRARMQTQLEGMTSQLGSSNSMFSGMSPEQVITAISTLTESQFKGFDEATQKLITAILQLALGIKDLDSTVSASNVNPQFNPYGGSAPEIAEMFMNQFKDKFRDLIGGQTTREGGLALENRLGAEQIAMYRARRQALEDQWGSYAPVNAEYVALAKAIEDMQHLMQANTTDIGRLTILRAQYGANAEAMFDLENWFEQQRVAIGANQEGLLALEELYQRKRKEIIESGNDGALDGLRDWLKGLVTGDLSPLTNEQKLAELKKHYEEALAGGKYTEIQSSAQAYLQLARQMYASSPLYNAIFGEVFTQIDQLAGTGINWQEAITNALPTTSTLASSDDIADLRQAVVDVGHRIATTNTQAANDIASSITQQSATGYYA